MAMIPPGLCDPHDFAGRLGRMDAVPAQPAMPERRLDHQVDAPDGAKRFRQ
jgi:hypothetical protein